MLKLHKLEINGFKSFNEKVSTEFSPGITAIVGPNGCGKSNLSEAILWVLGEQSAKSLRGGRMEDVIFSGSERRKPLGMAEVALTLQSTEPLDLPVKTDDPTKVTIGRRVFRNGESQYRINDKLVRLRDIKDLLADTGLGVRAYAVIEQGKIGQILSTKPQERRKLIEEAAGITRYKARKRLAELKLEEATSNRMRLDDIVSEVERSMRSLKRQAGAARRYKRRRSEYLDLLRQVIWGRWFRLTDEQAELTGQLDAAEQADTRLLAELTAADAQLTATRATTDRLGQEVSDHRHRTAQLGARIEGRQQQGRGARQTLHEINERLQQGDHLATTRKTELQEVTTQIESLATRVSELEREHGEAGQAASLGERLLLEAEQALQEVEQRQQQHRNQLVESVAAVSAVHAKLQRSQVDQEKSKLRNEQNSQSLDAKQKEIETSSRETEQASAGLQQLESRIEQIDADLQAKRNELDAILNEESEASSRQQNLSNEVSSLRHRLVLLQQIASEEHDRRERLRGALTDLGVADAHFLDELVSSPEGWEEAVDFFLEPMRDLLVLPAGHDPLALARLLSQEDHSVSLLAPTNVLPADPFRSRDNGRSNGNGRRSWLQSVLSVFGRSNGESRHDASSEDSSAVDLEHGPTHAIVSRLGDALGVTPEIANALPPVYLVEDSEAALELARRNPGVAFLCREQLWTRDGVVHAQSVEAQPGHLGREREIEEIEERLPVIDAELDALRQRLEELVAARTETARQVNEIDTQRTALQQNRAVAVARRQDGLHRHQRLEAEHASLIATGKELEAHITAGTESRQLLETESATVRARHQELEQNLEQLQAEVEKARAHRETTRTECAHLKGQLRLFTERRSAQDQDRQRHLQRRDTVAQQLEQWQHERQRLDARVQEQQQLIETAERELQEALEEQHRVAELQKTSETSLEEQRQSVHAQEKVVASLRAQRDSTRESLEQLRVRRATLEQEIQHLRATAREQLDIDLATPLAAAQAADASAGDADSEALAADEPADGVVVYGAFPTQADSAAPSTANEPAIEAAEQDPRDADGLPADVAVEAVADEPVPQRLSEEELLELEEQLSHSKRRVDAIGPVNVLAAEELDENESRYGTLIEQRNDVSSSIDSLRKTIREINQTSNQRFLETFAQVNKALGHTFAELFRGGEASMQLLDEEDPIESGIEIMARPPGKRLTNIQLMSGGEKALTAIALLFALFRTKPSPFCILDEVDAPLDDANVLRFIDVLRHMSAETQFLVVTHNKLTMQVASTLYGVTMPEKGISKLVGVDLDDMHPEAQIA